MKLKLQKGSVTIFVLIALLFYTSFLLLLYAANTNKLVSIKEKSDILKGIYEKNTDNNSINELYIKNTISNSQDVKKSTNKNDSYVNCFADIDDDGTVDGIIFVDLLTGSVRDTQKWTDNNGVYTLPTDVTINNVNNYVIKSNYTDAKFGTHEVISPKTTGGKERFYIMQLTNFTTTDYIEFYWYKNAYENMSPIITSNNFGEGKENTRKMIAKWNAAETADGYSDSPKDDQDIWKHLQQQYSQGWYLPSRGELSAFLNEIGGDDPITSSNYNSTYGLRGRILDFFTM